MKKTHFLYIAIFLILFSFTGCPAPGSDNVGEGTPVTYTVTYDGNGSTTGAVPKDTAKYIKGSEVTILGNTANLSKFGYTYAGWNTQKDGTGTSYTQGQILFIDSDNITLYAMWTQLPTYKVTYNGNGSSGGTIPTDSTNYLSGAMVTILGNDGHLTLQGHAFAGWNTQADGNGTTYAFGTSFTMGSEDVTLFAKWETAYTVTYNANTTGTTGSAPIDLNLYLEGATVAVSGQGYLAKSGYTLIGWNTLADGTGTTYNVQNPTFIMGNSNVILYGMWAVAYTVAYDANGGEIMGQMPVDSNVYLQNAIVTVLTRGGLYINGFAFDGWNTQADGNGTHYDPGDTFAISSNITFYAQWLALTVTYNDNNSNSGTVPIDPNNHMTGWAVTVLGNSGNLTKMDYTFIGWNTQANGQGNRYMPGDSFPMGTAPLILYAMWTNLPTYTVVYDGNDSTGGTPPIDSNSYLPGDTVKVLSNYRGAVSFVKEGFKYSSWNTEPDETGATYVAYGINYYVEDTFVMGNSNVTLYAVWYTAGLSFTPYTSGTYGATSYSVKVGTAIGNIVISSTAGGIPVVAVAPSGFYNSTVVTGVHIPPSVTSIGNAAFRGCTGLTYVTLPSELTSIGQEAFLGCTGLTSITIPEGVTSIGSNAFTNCTGITSISIPTTLSSIAGAFMGCNGLTSVTIPYGVTDIQSAFNSCHNLINVTIPDSVTNIDSAFDNCTSLTIITIPDSVTSMRSAFQNCSSLQSMILPNGLTTIGDYAFRGCINLESVTIPNTVTSIGSSSGHTFDGCTSLASVTIPDSVTSIRDDAFIGCSSLTSVTLPSSVSYIGNVAFANCTNLQEVIVNATTPPTSNNGYMFGGVANNTITGCPNLTAIRVPADNAIVVNYQTAQYWQVYAFLIVSQ